ncbi:hypothetical protein SALBM311S_00227 [Streptomyces alboniger]
MLGFIAYPVISVFYYSLQNYNPDQTVAERLPASTNRPRLHRRPGLLEHAASAPWVVVVGSSCCSVWRWR